VGLGGEIRSVGNLDRRMSEAARLGFSKAIVPASGAGKKHEGITLMAASTLPEALSLAHLGS
jgi:DNA repair protein RadA/Sms